MKLDQHSVLTADPGFVLAGGARPSPDDEIEIKFLIDSKNPQKFTILRDYFRAQNLVKLSLEDYHLISRQLDTPSLALRARQAGLRLRGNCLGEDLNNIETPDLCLKLAKGVDRTGTLHRHEFQSRIGDFNTVSFEEFFKRYPLDEYPAIAQALEGVEPKDLREFFRVDCFRNRYVIELPEAQTGLKGQRVCAELITDNCAFVLDTDRGLRKPMLIGHDLEVECEVLFRPCDFDNNPQAARYSSSPLTNAEIVHVMDVVTTHVMTALDGQARINHVSKSERGFAALNETLEALPGTFVPNTAKTVQGRGIAHAFAVAALNPVREFDLHRSLPRYMGYVFGQRNIAARRPPAVH